MGEINRDSATSICRRIVSLHHSLKVAKSCSSQQFLRLKEYCDTLEPIALSVTATRISDYIPLIDNSCLTSILCKEVDMKFENSLEWKQEKNELWFESENSGKHFCVNVLNGLLLVDGNPIGSLPRTITSNHLCKHTFGKRNFEVLPMGTGYRTKYRISGRHYFFYLLKDNQLVVTEEDPDLNLKSELIDISCSYWKKELENIPQRWKHKSWWLDRKCSTLVVRGQDFSNCAIEMILFNASVCWRAFEYLAQNPKYNWTQLNPQQLSNNQNFRELLIAADGVSTIRLHTLKMLEKFENRSFIECYRSHDARIIFALPRYSLSFENIQFEGESRKETYESTISNFILSPCQQLPNTLIGFTRYLVLEKKKSSATKC